MGQELYNATCEGLKEIGLGSWFLPQNFSICGIKNRGSVPPHRQRDWFVSAFFTTFPVFATYFPRTARNGEVAIKSVTSPAVWLVVGRAVKESSQRLVALSTRLLQRR